MFGTEPDEVALVQAHDNLTVHTFIVRWQKNAATLAVEFLSLPCEPLHHHDTFLHGMLDDGPARPAGFEVSGGYGCTNRGPATSKRGFEALEIRLLEN